MKNYKINRENGTIARRSFDFAVYIAPKVHEPEERPIKFIRGSNMESNFSRLSDLQDICDIEISQELCFAEKKKAYIEKTGSNTSHKVGSVEVECVYGNMKLNKMLVDLISK